MIVPSIDLQDGRTVQLVGGKQLALEAGDPRPLAQRFGRAGEVAVVDLDAAKGHGSNEALVRALLPMARCRVGGGIRSAEAALRWLDAGAAKVVLGTAATPAILGQLPRERVVVALDADHGEVVTEGWTKRTGSSVEKRMEELSGMAGGFLVTFVEREGRMKGIDLDEVNRLAKCVGDASLTVAGGITTASEIATLDRMGVDAQIGMALYTGRLSLAESLAAPLRSDRSDGLWPTVVSDERGLTLGLCWSNAQSLERAIETGRGVYWSRRRGLWEKGSTSGAVQELVEVKLDCDRDALQFRVRQLGNGFCHLPAETCFGAARGIAALERRIADRIVKPVADSYSGKLLNDPELLREKLREEALELANASTREEVVHEAADVMYFTAVAMARSGVRFSDVEQELERRALRVVRRGGRIHKHLAQVLVKGRAHVKGKAP